uniref:Uncharacterized protein n=1 Tax=Oncorhynchus tshawytscha TaxID=74940 RepID=A0A8C8J0V7_ONCTS
MWATDEISQLCYECFSELPKRGKPEPGREWMLLAAVAKVCIPESRERSNIRLCFISTVEVVSLGAGTSIFGT